MVIGFMLLHLHLLLSKPNLLVFFRLDSLSFLINRYPLYVAILGFLIVVYIGLSIYPSFLKNTDQFRLDAQFEGRLQIIYGILSIIWIITILIIVIFFELRTVHINAPSLHDLWTILTIFVLLGSMHLLSIRLTS